MVIKVLLLNMIKLCFWTYFIDRISEQSLAKGQMWQRYGDTHATSGPPPESADCNDHALFWIFNTKRKSDDCIYMVRCHRLSERHSRVIYILLKLFQTLPSLIWSLYIVDTRNTALKTVLSYTSNLVEKILLVPKLDSWYCWEEFMKKFRSDNYNFYWNQWLTMLKRNSEEMHKR